MSSVHSGAACLSILFRWCVPTWEEMTGSSQPTDPHLNHCFTAAHSPFFSWICTRDLYDCCALARLYWFWKTGGEVNQTQELARKEAEEVEGARFYLVGSKLHSGFAFNQSGINLHNDRLYRIGTAPALRTIRQTVNMALKNSSQQKLTLYLLCEKLHAQGPSP